MKKKIVELISWDLYNHGHHLLHCTFLVIAKITYNQHTCIILVIRNQFIMCTQAVIQKKKNIDFIILINCHKWKLVYMQTTSLLIRSPFLWIYWYIQCTYDIVSGDRRHFLDSPQTLNCWMFPWLTILMQCGRSWPLLV